MSRPLKDPTEITISRSTRRPGYSYMLIAGGMLDGCSAADIRREGQTGLVVRFAEDGRYRVRGAARCYNITVPADAVRHVPFGRSIAPWRMHPDDPHAIVIDLKDLWRNTL